MPEPILDDGPTCVPDIARTMTDGRPYRVTLDEIRTVSADPRLFHDALRSWARHNGYRATMRRLRNDPEPAWRIQITPRETT